MPYLLRTLQDVANPTLSGGVWGKYITIAIPVYFHYAAPYISGILFISDGGKYGLDKIDSFEYGGAPLTVTTEYIFHRGTFPKQIEPIDVSVNATTNFFTSLVAHGLLDDDNVRLRSVDGNLPTPLEEGILGHSKKYFIVNKTPTTFQLSLTLAGAPIDITNIGTGTLKVWFADSGFDDPEQGLPTFCPEVESTFSNIAYIEFRKNFGSADPPNWANFRTYGTGRRLMDYDNTGAELGIIAGDDDALANGALCVIDNLLWNLKIKPSRNDWVSWFLMKEWCDVDILQRVRTDETAVTNGLIGRYFNDTSFTNFVISRLDPDIDFNFGTSAPAPLMPSINYSVIWKGQIKPRYSELYDLIAHYDDYCYLAIDGNVLIDSTAVTTTTVQYTFVADQIYDIEVRYKNFVSVGYIDLKWQSATQANEIIPTSRLYPSDEIVKRARIDTAFNTPTEGSEVHERLMERIVGYHWTDDNGLIKYLPPDRNITFAFVFDRADDDSKPNFANKSFQKKRRAMTDRKNFQLFIYRNIGISGYPTSYAQADREELRKFINGEPSNDPAPDLGVTTPSQAQRMAEMEMVLKSDPQHLAQIVGSRSSSVIRKNHIITATYYDLNGNYVIDESYLVTLHSWGSPNGANGFSLLPLRQPFTSDEPVTP